MVLIQISNFPTNMYTWPWKYFLTRSFSFSYCCVDPGKGRFADIHYRSISNDTVFLLPGHYYTYRCWFGYEHEDGGEFKNITCLNDGTWTDPGGAPNCIPKKCPLPGKR